MDIGEDGHACPILNFFQDPQALFETGTARLLAGDAAAAAGRPGPPGGAARAPPEGPPRRRAAERTEAEAAELPEPAPLSASVPSSSKLTLTVSPTLYQIFLEEAKTQFENHPTILLTLGDISVGEEKFKEAAEAYEVLSDEDKRHRYDQFGHEGMRVGADYHGYTNINDVFSHFQDIFGSAGFGGSIFDDVFNGGRGRTRSRQAGIPGSDLKIRLKLTLEEIATGVEKKLKVRRWKTCDVCNGSGAKNAMEL